MFCFPRSRCLFDVKACIQVFFSLSLSLSLSLALSHCLSDVKETSGFSVSRSLTVSFSLSLSLLSLSLSLSLSCFDSGIFGVCFSLIISLRQSGISGFPFLFHCLAKSFFLFLLLGMSLQKLHFWTLDLSATVSSCLSLSLFLSS